MSFREAQRREILRFLPEFTPNEVNVVEMTNSGERLQKSLMGMDQLHYKWLGGKDEPPVVFLHGFMGSGEDWKPVIDLLSPPFCFLTIDLPGHGKTLIVNKETDYTMPSTAHAVIRLLDRLNIKECCLVSYSLGGRLALYLALHYPERFIKVVLESASPGLKTQSERLSRQERDNELALELEHGELHVFLENWYNQPIFQSLKAHPHFHRLFQQRLHNSSLGLAKSLRFMGTGNQPSLWPKLKENKIPLLLLTGKFDAKFRAIAHQMAEECGFAQTRVIGGCGHNIHFEKPKEFASQIERFLIPKEKRENGHIGLD